MCLKLCKEIKGAIMELNDAMLRFLQQTKMVACNNQECKFNWIGGTDCDLKEITIGTGGFCSNIEYIAKREGD